MKTNKSILLLFAVVMFFQSCTVYKSVPISLELAVENNSKVKVKTLNNKKFKYKWIEVKDGNFYGVNKSERVTVRTPLNQEEIKSINEKNKTLSLILSFGIPVVFYGGLFLCCRDGFGYY